MLSNEKWFGASAGFYPFEIGQSLRINVGDAPRLTKTFGSGGNRQKWTFSFWLKRSEVTTSLASYLFNAYSSGSEANFTFLHISNENRISAGGYGVNYFQTNMLARDISSWYNIVYALDTQQATASNRFKLYVNGTQITSFASGTQPSINDLAINDAIQHTLFANYYNGSYDSYTGGCFADVNFIDNQQLDASSFGEFKNGVWIPIDTAGLNFGTTGFRLEFKGTGTATSSGAVSSPTNIGDDTSGNNNHFAVTGFASTDVVLDSPTNNFAVLNAIEPSSVTLSEGNLLATVSSGFKLQRSTFFVQSGKWYWEILSKDGGNGYIGASTLDEAIVSRGAETNLSAMLVTSDGDIRKNASESSYGNSVSDGDIIGVALDMDNGKIYFSENGTYYNSGNPASSANPATTGLTSPLSPSVSLYDNEDYIANFGQDSSFAGEKTAQGNTDDNGNGDFYYAPPSGYLALCSSNLPDTTISPNQDTQADDHFNTVLYSGNASNTHQITGVGFQPDWLWIKSRNVSAFHYVADSSRGLGTGDSMRGLGPNSTTTEFTAENDQVRSFDTDGFTLDDNTDNTYYLNRNSETYVAWNWKAGGTTPTKTYKVVVVSDSGNKYRFRNSADSATFAQSAVTLDLQEGGTYVFDWSDSTAQGHPIRFSTTSDGTHGSGSEYTTGVVKDDSAYKTTITVAGSAPTLYYYCQNHSGMGGQVNTNTTHGSTNFDGSILSVSQTNETAGFSIATYTGSASGTVGHGLSQAPDIIIVKSRTVTNPWVIYTSITGKDNYLVLNTTAVSTSTSNYWGTGGVTSSVFGIYSNSAYANVSGDLVAYCFHNVEGYSKIGSYTGNGSTDGTFVYTGFRPAFVMIKTTTISGQYWILRDNKRDTFNNDSTGSSLYANTPDSEGTGNIDIDFLSNGMKMRDSGNNTNGSGTYIYMAFAEQPFKFSNAR